MSSNGISRRDALGAGAAGLLGILVDPYLFATARAQGASLERDPRYPFADRLCDLAIPATDTPGAAAAGVAGFVLLVLDRRMGDLQAGMLDAVRGALDASGNADFLQLPPAKQAELLALLDQRAYAGDKPPAASAEYAWRRIKAAIVAGYYTSEIGATQELVYEPVPGAFRSFKLTADFRARSNDGFGGTL